MSKELTPVVDLIKDISISSLLNTQTGQDINHLYEIYKRFQQEMYALMTIEDPKGLASLKIGTVLVWSVISKLFSNKDKKISSFTEDDWKEIATAVSELAVKPDGQAYTEWVFSMYSEYIRSSANLILSDRKNAVLALADELDSEKSKLHDGQISESRYVEDCMWICLESMVKLLSSVISITGANGEKAQAIADFLVQYGRLMLYKKEQALLDEYLENQRVLDEVLKAEFENFKKELIEIAEKINSLIVNAYDPDIRVSLQNTAKLARVAGVPEEEILDTIEKIDDFFM